MPGTDPGPEIHQNDAFTPYISGQSSDGSNRASSHIRAIDLLDSILSRKAAAALGQVRMALTIGQGQPRSGLIGRPGVRGEAVLQLQVHPFQPSTFNPPFRPSENKNPALPNFGKGFTLTNNNTFTARPIAIDTPSSSCQEKRHAYGKSHIQRPGNPAGVSAERKIHRTPPAGHPACGAGHDIRRDGGMNRRTPDPESYCPPYEVSETAATAMAWICENVGRRSALQERQSLRLRRVNRIRTIQGSLAIEGNTLTETQISAVLEGKPVVAPPREVQEVRNAIKVYEEMPRLNPHSEADLLRAHQMLMAGLVDAPGCYRRSASGVMGKDGLVHIAPPADLVTFHMRQLLAWLKSTSAHPLIAGSVFHYEFEFIHPFDDGNGRMGRLWQSLILQQWNPLFADLPVESLIHARQADYYAALNQSTNLSSCTPFIDFMLLAIQDALLASPEATQENNKTTQVTTQERGKSTQEVILGLLRAHPDMTRNQLSKQVGITPDGVKYHLERLKARKAIRHVGPTKCGHWEVLE